MTNHKPHHPPVDSTTFFYTPNSSSSSADALRPHHHTTPHSASLRRGLGLAPAPTLEPSPTGALVLVVRRLGLGFDLGSRGRHDDVGADEGGHGTDGGGDSLRVGGCGPRDSLLVRRRRRHREADALRAVALVADAAGVAAAFAASRGGATGILCR